MFFAQPCSMVQSDLYRVTTLRKVEARQECQKRRGREQICALPARGSGLESSAA